MSSDKKRPPSPLLQDADFNQLCRDLLRSGEISSDGELSEIARQEISRQTTNMETVNIVVKQNIANWVKEEPPALAMLNGGDITSTIFIHTDETGLNPPTDEFPGDLGFEIKVSNGTKSKEAHFSEVLGKLYINQNRFANFEFSLNVNSGSVSADTELFIRAVCIFTSADDYLEPVKVCYSHSRDSIGNPKSNICEHLVRCSHPSSIYQQDQVSNRHSVISPFQKNHKMTMLAYKFMDLGSCSGGLNRRETAVIFSLENSAGDVLGRRVLPVRICTCPRRDLEQEEKNREKQLSKSSVLNVPPSPGPDPIGAKNGEKRKAFWILAYGQENFDTMRILGETLERKDGGDVQQYREYNRKANGIQLPCKKKKTNN